MIRNILATTLAAVLSFSAVGAFAQQTAQRQVVFIGDNPSWGQQPQFQAHKNWQNMATDPALNQGPEAVESQLSSVINSGEKPIIHLMFGTGSFLPSPGNPPTSIFAQWAVAFEEIISTAQEAHLKIIVGTVPWSGAPDDESAPNKWMLLYCAAHNIPVVNYDYAVNSGTGFSASNGLPSSNPSTPSVPQPPVYLTSNYEGPPVYGYGTPTSAAWDLITDMAQTAIIQVEGYQVKGGYLNTVSYNGNGQDHSDFPVANTNTVADRGYVQFTPYLQYTDGSTHIANNADVYGRIGTFTSSDPFALSVDQTGAGRVFRPGTVNIHFTTLAGRTINEWVEYTYVDDGCGCTGTY